MEKRTRASVQLEDVFCFEAIKFNKIQKMFSFLKILLIKRSNKISFERLSEHGQVY